MRRSGYKTTVQPEDLIYNQKTHTKTQRLMRRSGYKTTVQPEGYIDTHKNTEIDETIQI